MLILPARNQRIDGITRENVKAFLVKHSIIERLPKCNEIEVEIHEPISDSNIPIHKIHKTWTASGMLNAQTIAEFPGKYDHSRRPKDLMKIAICCIDKRTGGMSSQFGFTGLYVSLLISLSEDLIWDVRSDNAF